MLGHCDLCNGRQPDRHGLKCCGRRTHRSTCRCCDRSACPSTLYNGDFCEDCMIVYYNRVKLDHTFVLGGFRGCAVPGCQNKSCQGSFVGDFCAPCHDYVVGKSCGSGENLSQAYRNELVKNNLRLISSVDVRRRRVESSYHRPHDNHENLESVRLLLVSSYGPIKTTVVTNDNVDLLVNWEFGPPTGGR